MALWSVVLPALISGVVSAALVPFVQQRFVWRTQKRIEFRRAAFDKALNALAMRETDAYSPSVQSKPAEAHGLRRVVEMRDETAEQMQRARYLVRAFFPAATAIGFERALDAPISMKTVPDTEYLDRVAQAVRLLAEDIGLTDPAGPVFDRLWLLRKLWPGSK